MKVYQKRDFAILGLVCAAGLGWAVWYHTADARVSRLLAKVERRPEAYRSTVEEFRSLGPEAVPGLVKHLKNGNNPYDASGPLAAVGSSAVPELVHFLHRNRQARNSVVNALVCMEDLQSGQMQALIDLAKHET